VYYNYNTLMTISLAICTALGFITETLVLQVQCSDPGIVNMRENLNDLEANLMRLSFNGDEVAVVQTDPIY